MDFKKIIAAATAFGMTASVFSGFSAVYAEPEAALSENSESVYNFSTLTDESYNKSGVDVFGGALHLSANESMKPLSVSEKIATPLGNIEDVTSALISKKIAVQMTLAAGETAVVYYAGSDSTGTSAKALEMVVKDGSGAVVATENNDENKGGVKPYTISYKSEAGGSYTIVDQATTTNRTIVYAAAKTTTDFVETDPDKIPPSDITGLTATPGDNIVYLSWDADEKVDSYSLYVNDELDSTGITGTECIAVGLENGKEYTFKLVAQNAGGTKEATVTCTPAEPTSAPEAFTVSGTARDKGSSIYWSAAKYAKAYDVYRDGAVIASDVATTSYVDTGLENGKEYTYKVTAKNNYGTIDSNEIKVTPEEPPASEIKIEKSNGWLESAYIEWSNPAPADKYEVYVKPVGGEYTKLDDELVRYYGSYYRADAVGLKAGQYQMKIQSGDASVESDILDVKAYKREGFAFDPKSSHYNSDGLGAYKTDGTLKDGAQVLYISDENKDNVKFNVVTDTGKGTVTECTGLVEVLAAREKNNAETTPLAIRMIGQVESPAGKNSAGYVQLKACENITFEGIGDDATTYHWSFLMREAVSTEIRNLAVMEFYDDGISLDTKNYNCWVHNCDIFYGQDRGGDQKKGDGSLDVKSGSDWCTFSYNHFWDSGKCSLCGMKADNNQGYHMTYYGNWFDHSDSRMPRVRGDQVHVFNNYFDGNSKYGVGACTGSSVFVEKNVFRNVKYPMMISQQGSDIATDSKGTFSGEDGGIIKEFDNKYISGSQSHDIVAYNAVEAPVEFDAYVVKDASETVPSTVTAKKGGTSYSNFDTAADMYTYSALSVDQVVNDVQTYAGRIENGDFVHEFNDETDDPNYDRDTVLGGALQNYKSSIKSTYTSPKSYPATNGAMPSARPTQAPIPTTDPNATPSPTPEPPAQAAPTTWDFGNAPFTVTEGEAIHPDTQYFPLSSTADRYNINNTSITPDNFGGLTFKGVSEAGYQKSGKTFDDGFKGTWQLKTGSAGSANDKVFSFYPAADGSVKVYARSGSSSKSANLSIIQGTEKQTMELVATANETSLPVLAMNVTAGEQVKIYSDGNTGYYGIVYSSESYVEPTTDPNAPTNPPSEPTAPPTDPTNPPAVPTAKPGECVKITATYDNGRLVSVTTEKAVTADAVSSETGNTKVMYWDTLDSMKPVTVSSIDTPTNPPIVPGDEEPTVTIGTGYNWNANNMTAGTYTEAFTVDGLTIGAGAGTDETGKATEQVVIDTSNATIDGIKYTQRIKTGGKGNIENGIRVLSFVPDVNCTITLDATTSSSGTIRTVEVRQGEAVQTLSVSDKSSYAVGNIAAGKKVQIYSTEGGLNIYGIRLAPGSTVEPIETVPPSDPTTPPQMEAIVPQTASKTWTFTIDAYRPYGTIVPDSKGNDTVSITGVVDYDNLEVIATDTKAIVIDANNKTFGDSKYTERLKLGGTGKTTERAIKFIPGADGTVEIDALHSSSTGDARNLMVVQGTNEVPVSLTAGGDPVRSAAINVTANEPVYIYSGSSGINIYAVIYTAK